MGLSGELRGQGLNWAVVPEEKKNKLYLVPPVTTMSLLWVVGKGNGESAVTLSVPMYQICGNLSVDLRVTRSKCGSMRAL